MAGQASPGPLLSPAGRGPRDDRRALSPPPRAGAVPGPCSPFLPAPLVVPCPLPVCCPDLRGGHSPRCESCRGWWLPLWVCRPLCPPLLRSLPWGQVPPFPPRGQRDEREELGGALTGAGVGNRGQLSPGPAWPDARTTPGRLQMLHFSELGGARGRESGHSEVHPSPGGRGRGVPRRGDPTAPWGCRHALQRLPAPLPKHSQELVLQGGQG